MNSSVSNNQTSSLILTCIYSDPGFSIQLSVITLDFTVLLPIQIWVLWLGTGNFRRRGRLAASEIFTMNLSALEVFVVILYSTALVAYIFNYPDTVLLVMFFSGSYLVGRPFMNSLICLERYIAVAHPVIYRNPAFVKHRYIAAGLVWVAAVAYGGLGVFTYPRLILEIYIVALTFSLSVISACSLGVLKILLRPNPGETQKKGIDRQKKRAFTIITAILVWISVPYIIYVLLFIRKKYLGKDTFCLLVSISFWIMRPSSAMQSLLYLSKQKKLPCTRKANP